MAETKIRGDTQIIAASILNAQIAVAAAIATSKLSDGAKFIQSSGSVAFAANQPMGSHKITGLAAPTGDDDAATKRYVDAKAQGLDVKESCRIATIANLAATYSGTPNFTLTADSEGAISIDGVSGAVNDRVLVKNQTTGTENGIYTVTTVGDAGTPYVLTRAEDFDSSEEITAGAFSFVTEGTVNADLGFAVSTNDPITLDTTAIAFTQFSGLGQVTAGTGLTKTGNTIDAIGGNGITANADDLAVDVDGATLTVAAAGLKVSDAGITETQLHTSVAGNGLTGGGGAVLAVGAGNGITVSADAITINLDAATLTVEAGGLKVTAAGITATELNTSVAGDGLTGGGGTALAVGAGNGISVAANAVAVAADATGGANLAKAINVSANGVAVKVDASTINGNGSNQLYVPAAGITETQLNTSVAGNGLTGGGGTVLAVGAGNGITVAGDSVTIALDGATLAVGAGGLKVASAGITATQLATSVAGNGLTGGAGTALAVGAGTGLTVAADAINVIGGNGITANADDIAVDNDGTSITVAAAGIKVTNTVIPFTVDWIWQEAPNETPNGTITVFTVDNNFVTDKEMVFKNGLMMKRGASDDYQTTPASATVTFNTAPQTGDMILIAY